MSTQQKASEPLDEQAIGNALYGLQGMNSDSADVKLLLRAFSAQVERCTEPLIAEEVANALYRLHWMNIDDEDVKSLHNALSAQVERQPTVTR